MAEQQRHTAQGLIFGAGWVFVFAYVLGISLNRLQLMILFLSCTAIAFVGLRRKSEWLSFRSGDVSHKLRA
jgi:hypothetical protein